MGFGQGSHGGFRFPGLPLGWYAVAESHEVGTGQHLSRIYFGNKLRFYRTKAGDLRVTTPANLKKWPIREHNGLIFAWYHPDRIEPEWGIPVLPTKGWTDFRFREIKVESHPQETSENSVDVGHFMQVHGFPDAWYEGDLEIEGHLLKGAYGIDYGVFGRLSFVAKFEVEVHGLGYSLVKIHLPRFDMDIHTLILSTPIDEERVHLRMGMSIENWGVPVLPLLIREIASIRLAYEVAQDAPIWATKRYVEKPLLAEGDGPIAEYRRYCKQFYTRVEEAVERELPREQARVNAA